MPYYEEIEINMDLDQIEVLVRNFLERMKISESSMTIFEDMHDDFYTCVGKTIVNETMVSVLMAHLNEVYAEEDVAYAVPPGENKKPRYDAHAPTPSELEDLANSLNGE